MRERVVNAIFGIAIVTFFVWQMGFHDFMKAALVILACMFGVYILIELISDRVVEKLDKTKNR